MDGAGGHLVDDDVDDRGDYRCREEGPGTNLGRGGEEVLDADDDGERDGGFGRENDHEKWGHGWRQYAFGGGCTVHGRAAMCARNVGLSVVLCHLYERYGMNEDGDELVVGGGDGG